MDVKLAEESLSGSWLSTRLGVGTHRLDAMRLAAAGAVRPPEPGEEIIAARDRILSQYY